MRYTSRVFRTFIPERVHSDMNELSRFVKERRKILGLTQEDLSFKAGVGLRFVRDLEQGKETLKMDKVNAVLALFGHVLGPLPQLRNEEG